MARVYKQSEAKRLGLPGRTSVEIVSGEKGARSMTLRLVEIPVPRPVIRNAALTFTVTPRSASTYCPAGPQLTPTAANIRLRPGIRY